MKLQVHKDNTWNKPGRCRQWLCRCKRKVPRKNLLQMIYPHVLAGKVNANRGITNNIVSNTISISVGLFISSKFSLFLLFSNWRCEHSIFKKVGLACLFFLAPSPCRTKKGATSISLILLGIIEELYLLSVQPDMTAPCPTPTPFLHSNCCTLTVAAGTVKSDPTLITARGLAISNWVE